jgi:YesN/AraC family two-component response regulator
MNDPLETLKIKIYQADRAYCTKKWNYPAINSPITRIYLTPSGQGYATFHDKKYTLRPGKMHMLPSHTSLDLHCPKEMNQCYIHFTAEILNGIDIFKFYESKHEIDISQMPYVQFMFNRLEAAFNHKREEKELEMDGIIRYFCSFFLKLDRTRGQSQKIKDKMRFDKVFDYIEKNISRKISLDDLAGQINLQSTYFSNLFQKSFGIPPIKYLNSKRMEKAQRLLLYSNKNLAEIALQTGIDDVFYFSKLFKKHVGVSPDQYRKQKKIFLL